MQWCAANIAYCEISNAGVQGFSTFPLSAVYLQDWTNENISITNCKIRKCSAIGFYIVTNGAAQKMTFSGNTCEDVDGDCIYHRN